MRIVGTRIVRFDTPTERSDATPPYKGNERAYGAWYKAKNRERIREQNRASAARRRTGK